MPSNFLTADTKFPQIDNNKSDKENLDTVVNYLFVLLEQLRYTLGNLDTENFNETALEEFVNIITEPIYFQLQDDEENIANLMVQADSFSTRLQDAENNVSTLTQTSTALASRLQSAEGNISNLSQTADSLTSQVQSLDGSVSTLSQTVSSLRLSVSNGGTSSTIQLLSNNVSISSQTITLTGYVTFTDLSTSGKTTIHGDNIMTGTLTASKLKGQTVSLLNSSGTTVGEMTLSGSTTGSYSVELASYAAMKIIANKSNSYGTSAVYITDGTWHIQIGGAASGVYCKGAFIPSNDDTYSLGISSIRWSDLYCGNSTIQTSDLQKKDVISYGLEAYDKFFSLCRPISYKFKTGHRTHIGFGAQHVEEALAEAGLSTEDFAGFVKTPKEDGSGFEYGLRYGEWTALNTWKIQQLESRLKKLEQLHETD